MHWRVKYKHWAEGRHPDADHNEDEYVQEKCTDEWNISIERRAGRHPDAVHNEDEYRQEKVELLRMEECAEYGQEKMRWQLHSF